MEQGLFGGGLEDENLDITLEEKIAEISPELKKLIQSEIKEKDRIKARKKRRKERIEESTPLLNGLPVGQYTRPVCLPMPLNTELYFGIGEKFVDWARYEQHLPIVKNAFMGIAKLIKPNIHPREDVLRHIYLNLPNTHILYFLSGMNTLENASLIFKRNVREGVDRCIGASEKLPLPFKINVSYTQAMQNMSSIPVIFGKEIARRLEMAVNMGMVGKVEGIGMMSTTLIFRDNLHVSYKEHAGASYANSILQYLQARQFNPVQ